ncbi:hypothetical protein HYY27_10805, partial [bacterium]|nr:hypothetical protein [bacterium]
MARRRSRSFSVIVIPDDGSRTREFKVNALTIRTALILVLIGLGLSLFGGVSVLRLKGWEDAVDRLQTENARLRAEAEKVQKLSQALERLKATDQQIRTMLSGSVPLGEAPYDLGGATAEPSQTPASDSVRMSKTAPG